MPLRCSTGVATVITAFSLADPQEQTDSRAVFGSAGLCYVSGENGYDMPQAVEHAKAYVTKGIHAGKDVHIGEGHGPLNHFYAPVPMKIMK